MLLTPRPKYGDPQPSALGDFSLPTAEAGRCIPVVYGTVKLTGGNAVWWGDLKVVTVKKHVGGFLGIGGSDQTTGYKYFLGMQYALCYGAWAGGADGNSRNKVEFVGLLADDKLVPCAQSRSGSSSQPLTLTVDQQDLFGGDAQEGGIAGEVRFYEGTDSRASSGDLQGADDYLAAVQARTVPAYRGVCYGMFGKSGSPFYIGTTSYLKTLGFVIRRLPNPFDYPDLGAVLMNPTPTKFGAPTTVDGGTLTGYNTGSSFDAKEGALYWIESRMWGYFQDDHMDRVTVGRYEVTSEKFSEIFVAVPTDTIAGIPINIPFNNQRIIVDSARNSLYLFREDAATEKWKVYRFRLDNGAFVSSDVGYILPMDLGVPSGGTLRLSSDGTHLLSVDFQGHIWWGLLGQAATYTDLGIVKYPWHSTAYYRRAVAVLDATDTPYVLSFDDFSGTALPSYVSTGAADYLAVAITGEPCAGVYVASDNSIVWATLDGLWKWDVATKTTLLNIPPVGHSAGSGSFRGMSKEIGADGYIIYNYSKINPATLAIVSQHALTDWTPTPSLEGDPSGITDYFGMHYDAGTGAIFRQENLTGKVVRLSVESMLTGIANINGDANIALCIYDLLTHPVYGLRKNPATVDATSFSVAATTLATERLGISMIIDTPTDADSLISELLRHCDGVLFVDPQTALWTLKLARADYDPATLPELTPDQVLEPPEFSRGSWSETTNEVKVTFTDRSQNWKQNVSAPAQDAANIAVLGTVNSETVDFRGISNMTTATLVAARALRTLSYPLAKLQIKTNRATWSLRPGGCFRFTWAPLGIEDEVFRIARIGFGKVDDGTITIEAIEDIFGLSTVAFTSPPPSGWTDPATGDVAAPLAEIAMETPFPMLPTTTPSVRVLVGAVRGDSLSLGYQVWTDVGGAYHQTNTAGWFVPSGTLVADYSRTTAALDATGFSLANLVDFSLVDGTDDAGLARGDCLLLFEDTREICAFEIVRDNGDGTATISNVVRAVYDTLPANHAAGTRVWIIRDEAQNFLVDMSPDQTLDTGGDQFIVTQD